MIKGENEFMTDVLFYQNYTYVADISAIVLCIICWLLLHSSYAVREKSLVIFKAGTVCLMMATVCSISFHTAIARITEFPEGSYLCVAGWDISFPDSHVCSALQLFRCASKAGREAGKAFERGVLGRLCGVCFS